MAMPPDVLARLAERYAMSQDKTRRLDDRAVYEKSFQDLAYREWPAVAQELSRLREINQELLGACKQSLRFIETIDNNSAATALDATLEAAISKAEQATKEEA